MLDDKPCMAERALHSAKRGFTVPLPRQRELTSALWAFHLYSSNVVLTALLMSGANQQIPCSNLVRI
jgi:hypothetical protein